MPVSTQRHPAARRPILFYSAWQLGYHNLEAERKALALAEAGYEVVYVAGVGIRNPTLSNLPKLTDRVGRVLGARRRAADAGPESVVTERPPNLREGAVIVAPPRQYAAMRRLNTAWLQRQLRRQISPWSETLAWIRWPTPELVDALPRLRPARIVYEAVDAYEATPGIVGHWVGILARYERLLVERANLVVVPGERLAERYRTWGADVRIVPHGVDLAKWNGRPDGHGDPIVIGFAGTVDGRLDIPVLRAIALAHPEWCLRLIGPVQDGFDPRSLANLANVSFEPAVPAVELPALVASFDLGVMPYRDDVNTAHMTPVKNLEYLAAGVPAVARRVPALAPYADLLYFADSPREFVEGLERALAEQTRERAEARRRVAEQHGWPLRLAEVTAIAAELTGGPELS